MKHSLALVFAAAAATFLAAPLAAAPQCPGPSADSALTWPLVHTAAKIAGGGDLTIVAIGSSSTAGFGASSRETNYPSRLAAELRARLPGRKVEVLNKGIGGETHAQMMARFERDVMPYSPDLVIWQLGTNALLMEDGVTHDAPGIKAGISRLKAAGADVILMNPQYAPKVLKDPDHGEMVQLLDAVARESRVAVFGRFAIMREWVSSGGADFSTILSPDGLHMNDASYGCIAKLLAESIVSAPWARPPVIAASPAPIPGPRPVR
jgi:lysophospholipase L1-like esterase